MTHAEVEPVPVHIKHDDTKDMASKSRVQYATFHTFLANQAGEVILPHAEGRTEAIINVIGIVGTQGHVLLCDSQSMAQSVSATGEGPGTLLQPGMSVRVHWTTETWLVWLGDLIAPLVSVSGQYERGKK